jgi:DNA polymerase-3 subunit epsilon
MTGLAPETDRVIEVCIERVRGDVVVSRLSTLVRPEGLGDEVGNTKIHGIAAAELESAPGFAEIAGEVERLLDGAVLVAHGAMWDVAFLRAELARAGRTFEIAHWLDTLHLSRRSFALPRHSLAALRGEMGIDGARAHRADADVEALRAVFARCVAALDPRTPRDLWEVRIAERKAREQILASCEDAVKTQAPVHVVYRPRAKPQQEMTMIVVEVRRESDPPRVVGYLLPGRGRRELRADRVLRVEPVPQPTKPQ